MKMIAFVFSHAPHGTSFGREGLDAVLGISSLIKKIGLFFIGDGVLQLFKNYNVAKILSRDYIPSFSILSLYKINSFYCCKESLKERGFSSEIQCALPLNILDSDFLYDQLSLYDTIINF